MEVDLIARTDRVLADLEDAEVARFNRALDASYLRLEKDLLRRYPNYTADAKPNLLATERGLLLTSELKELLSLINPEQEQDLQRRYTKLLQTASKQGTTLSDELIHLRGGDSFVKATATVPIEAVAFEVKDAIARLKKHDQKFREDASVLVAQGLIQGWGASRTATQLRQQLGVVKSRAETIARTEVISAQDSAARANYKANGIEYVQRIATQDARVCVYCAERAGNVYPVDQAPVAIHPNDRCYNMPWMPEWDESDRINKDFIEQHSQDVRQRVEERGEQFTTKPAPFERINSIIPAKPAWTVKDGYIDPAVREKGQNWGLAALAAGLILRGRSPEIPNPEPDEENQLLKAIAIGAAIAGVSVGAYYLARARYRSGFKQSAQMADFIANDIDLSDPGDSDQITFVAGGFAGMQGNAGEEYAPLIGEILSGHHMVGVPTPEFDKGPGIGEDPLKNITTNWSSVVGTAVVDGRNLSSVRMAAMAAAHYRRYGKPVNLVGYSSGGMVTSEAHEILKEMGIPAKTATLGTPWFGFTDLSPDEHIGFMGKGDVFKGLPVQNRVELEGVGSHWLDRYLLDPGFNVELQNWFGITERPRQETQGSRSPRPDPVEVDATLVDLVPQLALLTEDEIKSLPGDVQQKLLAARRQANLTIAPPTAIQIAQARAALTRLQESGIELTPIDLGEAALETLSFLPAKELAALPESIRAQIEGAKQRQLSGRLAPKQLPGIAPFKALPGYEPLLELPGMERQLKRLLRGELPRLALPAGVELGPITEIERQAFERQNAQTLYRQARSVERSRSRLAEARVRQKLREVANSNLPPSAKLAAYRKAVFDQLSAIASPVQPRQAHGTANSEPSTNFDFAGISWNIPEFKEGSPSLDLIRKLAELELPNELLKHTNNIYISRQRNAFEDFWRKKLKLSTTSVPATFNLEDGSITFYRGRGKVEDLLRQMGYQMAYQRFGQLDPPESSEFRRAIAEGRPITTYGFNSPAADFADSVAQFFVDPDRMKRFNPQRYNAIARMINYRHTDKPVAPQVRVEDSRSPQIIAELRTRNAELAEQSRNQRQEAEDTAISQRSTRKIQQVVERVDGAQVQTQIEAQGSQVRAQEESLSRLGRRVNDLEQRSAQLLNPLNKPYFSESPQQIKQTQRQLRIVERELIAFNRIGAIANRVRSTSQQLQQVLGDLTTRKESLRLSSQGKQLSVAVTQLQGELSSAEQELINLPRTPERSQALRDLQRLKAAINSQQGGISVADLHRQSLTPQIQQLSELADDLDDLQQRAFNGRSQLTGLLNRLDLLPVRLTDLTPEQQDLYAQIKRTRAAQGKLPRQVESYRELRQQFNDQLAQRANVTRQLADGYSAERSSAANNVGAIAERRLERIRINLQVLASLQPGTVAWLVDSRNWDLDEIPSDLAIILQRQPQGTRSEKLRSAANEIFGLIAQVGGGIKDLNERLELPSQIATRILEQTQEQIRQWEGIRDALADEGRLSDKQLQALLKAPNRISALDVMRYGNQLSGDLEQFNRDFVKLLLANEDVDPGSIRNQAELYRRARDAFLEETSQTRSNFAREIEEALATARALEQRAVRDQAEPVIFEVNGKARTIEDIKQELEEARGAIADFLKLREVNIKVRETEEEQVRQQGRRQERDELQVKQRQLDTLRDELAEVNREIQKRREAAERGQKRGIATARLESQQRRILKDMKKVAREFGNGARDGES